MQNHPDHSWDAILRAIQAPGTARPPAPQAEPPSEHFVQQVRTMRAGLWELAKFMLWRRCSLIFALLSICLYALCHLLLTPESPRLIPTPSSPAPRLTQ